MNLVKIKHRLTRGVLRKLLCAGLCLTVVSGLLVSFSVPAKAITETSETAGGEKTDDYYLLNVSTGAVPGNSVKYFGIRYVDKSGTERTTMIFPHNNGMQAGFVRASQLIQRSGNASIIQEQTGYTAAGNPTKQREPLQANSSDQYLFRDYYGITELIGFDIYMEYADPQETGFKNEWTCNGIRLFKVDRLYGTRMVGLGDYNIDFDGELLGYFHKKQENAGDFSLEGDDDLFRIRSGNSDPYEVVTSGFDRTYRMQDNLKDLIFRVDFADTVGAGIESLAIFPEDRTDGGKFYDAGLREALTIRVRYMDRFGAEHEAYLPVYAMFVGFLATQNADAFCNLDLNGFMQQGDTVAFNATLPDFDTLVGYSLIYGNEAESAARIKNINYTGTVKTEIGDRLAFHNGLIKQSDTMAYTGVSIYDAAVSRASASLEGIMVRCSVEGTPLYYYKAKTTDGQTQPVNTERTVAMTKVDPASTNAFTLLPKTAQSAYIVEIATDTIEAAATKEDLTVELKYKNRSGEEKMTKTYKVKEAVAEYLGYWPYSGTVSEKTNVPYLMGTASGGKMAFAVKATDVDYFTAITLTLEKSGETVDEWQMKSVAIYKVGSIPQRSGEWLPSPIQADTVSTDRRLYRTLNPTDREQYCTQKVLLNQEINSITITFDTNGGGKTEEGDVEWEQIKDSMSYYEALQDLGFTKSRYQYEVNVSVKSNASASDDYGDCGSNNKFYFQLVFEDGSSGYVQANQQLTADGFRAGRTETFVIALNRDYGELKAVHIIPDDMLDGSDIYDKLNIDTIEIVMIGTGGLSRSWRIEDVGWIDIDYKDSGSQNTNGGQRLRSEAELTDNYLISSQGYSMNFMVAVGTGEYPTEDRIFQGSLTATFTYVDSTGTQTKTIDVAEAIADYAKKNTAECVAHGQDADLGGKSRRLIDNKYMFRENHVDRFIVSLSDVRSIKSVKFNTMGTRDTRWTVKSVDIYQIIEDGPLLLNANNEYQRDAKLEHLTGDDNVDGTFVDVETNKVKSITVYMTDNTITVDTEQWKSVIERVPSTSNDTMNLYVYLSKNKTVTNPEKIKAKISYQKRDVDKSFMITATDLTYVPAQNLIYGLGINAAKLSVLRQLTLISSESNHVDYALIQHVRSGVVIDTYYFAFGNGEIKNLGLSIPAIPVKSTNKDAQVVSLSLSADTVAATLVPEEQDIAVAITYTTTNDVNENTYDSRYIYLTDQQITKIGAGMAVDITFNEPYLKEIKKITLVGVGDISAGIDKVMIVTYRSDENGVKKLDGIYGITETIHVTRGARSRTVSDEALSLFEMNFNNVMQDAVNNGYASMDVYVTTDEGTDQVIHLTDLKNYTTAGDVLNQGSATVRVMMENVSAIHYVVVRPHSTLATEPVKWYISSVSGYWMIAGEQTAFAQTVKQTVSETAGLAINLADPYISVTAKLIEASDGGGVYSRNTNTRELNDTTKTHSNSLDLSVTPGRYLTITPTVTDALPGASCSVKLTHVSGGEHGKLTEVGGQQRFEIEGELTDDEVYRVEIVSEQCPDHILTLNITVQKG